MSTAPPMYQLDLSNSWPFSVMGKSATCRLICRSKRLLGARPAGPRPAARRAEVP
jgi:hypothetical protein